MNNLSCFLSVMIISLSDKLIPKYKIHIDNKSYEDSNKFIEFITDFSRTLLTEIAHQSLPPSGIPYPTPKLINRRAWRVK